MDSSDLFLLFCHSDHYFLWCCHVLYIGEEKKKEYFTKLLCKYTLKVVSLENATGLAFFFCERSSEKKQLFPPHCSSLVFASSSVMVYYGFFYTFAFPSYNPCPKAVSRHLIWESNYGISVPFSHPPCGPMPLQWRRPSNEILNSAFSFLFLQQNVSDKSHYNAANSAKCRLGFMVDNTGQNTVELQLQSFNDGLQKSCFIVIKTIWREWTPKHRMQTRTFFSEVTVLTTKSPCCRRWLWIK